MNYNFFRKTILMGFLMISKLLFSQEFDIQGHRGVRGLLPENSIQGFLAALDSGVTTLELDVVITGDKQVLVSHESYISANICLKNDGSEIASSLEKQYNIYRMDYEEVRRFDCGSKPNLEFPDQLKIKTHKPLLSEVITSSERHIKSYTQFEVDYNIELKSLPTTDNQFHPEPQEFSNLVYNLVDQYLPMERIVIQSFDFRILRYWHTKYPSVRISALAYNTKKSIDTDLANLGFKPNVYSPYYKKLNKKRIKNLQNKGIKVIPWTINDEKTILKLINWGVDGIISDYPNKVLALYNRSK